MDKQKLNKDRLNKLMAIKIMGMSLESYNILYSKRMLPNFCDNIADAFMLILKMIEDGHWFGLCSPDGDNFRSWSAVFENIKFIEALAPTPSLAIVLAIEKTLEVDDA